MIGVLDPNIFLPRADSELCRDLDWVVEICRQHSILIPPLQGYWSELWKELGKPLESQVNSQTKLALQAVRRLATSPLPMSNLQEESVWKKGFQQMFATPLLGTIWEDRMARAVVLAFKHDPEVVLLTRQIENRNIIFHKADHSCLPETTRWVLHTQTKIYGHRQVLCVHHARNLQERWTSRFDWRLPASSDGGNFPFCPPNFWWKGSTNAVRTVQSKPAFIDRSGNGWARPNISGGEGYHWDLFLSASNATLIGSNQINVVGFGVPPKQGSPGNIHHTPDGKPSAQKGWKC